MALKAGYVGVKRWLYEKLQATAAKNVQDIANIWYSNTVVGAKNFLKNNASSTEVNGITYTVNADGTIKAVGTATANAVLTLSNQNSYNYADLAGKTFKLTGGFSADAYVECYFSNPQTWNRDTGSGKIFTFPDTETFTFNFTVAVRSGQTVDLVFKPMLRLVSDESDVYAPYAMTNQQLTGSADDQKTAINAIISAATGAADFAAFKTAMAAISPVTRSAAPDTREASPEVIADDPEPVTKTTKKTTKKEDN